ncbi:MAG: AI-2E family transporter [Oscillospiraceae bacterium]|jgi:predicted PurR-regulated permease PerM|nr:AI-2E family transporter [Oscillospiraceae bacterium]
MRAVRQGWSRRGLILLGAGALAALLLWWRAIVSVLALTLCAALLALLMLPLAMRFEARMKPGGAAALALVILMAGLLIFVGLVVPAITVQTEQLFQHMPGILERLSEWSVRANQWLGAVGLPALPDLSGALMGLDLSVILKGVVSYAGGVLGQLAQWLIAPMLAFYFMRDRERFSYGLTMLIPIKHRRMALWIASETRRALMVYVRGHALVSLSVGALSAVGLLIVGVPSWLALGVWLGLTDLVPYFGPLLGIIPILLFGPAIGLTRMVWSLVIVLAVNQAEANLITPNVIGEQTGIHPVTVLIALLLGNLMFGLWGIVLSLPALIVFKTVSRTLRAAQDLGMARAGHCAAKADNPG